MEVGWGADARIPRNSWKREILSVSSLKRPVLNRAHRRQKRELILKVFWGLQDFVEHLQRVRWNQKVN